VEIYLRGTTNGSSGTPAPARPRARKGKDV
jgi:hypothetical protein